jgi:hypothetical protein
MFACGCGFIAGFDDIGARTLAIHQDHSFIEKFLYFV